MNLKFKLKVDFFVTFNLSSFFLVSNNFKELIFILIKCELNELFVQNVKLT